MKRIAVVAIAALAACGGSNKVPPPQPSIALPPGSQLKPYAPSRQSFATPYGLDQSGGLAYVALGNAYADFSPAGPGFLAAIVPSTGATTLIDLGGSNGRQCQNAFFVRALAGKVYVTCSGDFNTGSGTAIVEVDPAIAKATRSVTVPVSPAGVALGPTKLWFGDASTGNVYSIDRGTFAVSTGHASAQCPAGGTYIGISDVMTIQGDLYALCSNSNGAILSRLDATTGALKGSAQVGPIATELTETGDGRIAVINAGDNTLSLVTIGSNGALSASTALTFSGKNDILQDVRSHGHYLFTVESANNTAQKVDLTAKGGPRVVAEASFGANANPWNILPLDDDQAIVTNQKANTVAAAQWVPVP